MKRAADVVLAGLLLLLTAPLLLGAAAAVHMTMGGPALFKSRRAGLGGAPFDLLKLRTMRPPRLGEEGPECDGRRLTRVGRVLRSTSLDELPSLVNVLRGEMSLVGPRPLPVQYLPRYSAQQARRHEVRPGVTGWAVVNGRNRVSWDDRLLMDVWYVDHRSLGLDARILRRSIGLVLRGDGVDHAEGVTMTEFTGARS